MERFSIPEKFLQEHTIVTVGDDRIVDDPPAFLRCLSKNGLYVKSICWWVRWPVAEKNAPGGGGPRDPRDPNYYFSEMYHWKEQSFSADTAPDEILACIEEKRAASPAQDLVPSFTVARKEKPAGPADF